MKNLYEVLIRFKDGIFSGAHVQYEDIDGEYRRELPVEPLSLDNFADNKIMHETVQSIMVGYVDLQKRLDGKDVEINELKTIINNIKGI